MFDFGLNVLSEFLWQDLRELSVLLRGRVGCVTDCVMVWWRVMHKRLDDVDVLHHPI
jgi:hypothetical protein